VNDNVLYHSQIREAAEGSYMPFFAPDGLSFFAAIIAGEKLKTSSSLRVLKA
jgi:hypothetical protein